MGLPAKFCASAVPLDLFFYLGQNFAQGNGKAHLYRFALVHMIGESLEFAVVRCVIPADNQRACRGLPMEGIVSLFRIEEFTRVQQRAISQRHGNAVLIAAGPFPEFGNFEFSDDRAGLKPVKNPHGGSR